GRSGKKHGVRGTSLLGVASVVGAGGAYFSDGIFARSHPWRDRRGRAWAPVCARVRGQHAAAGGAPARSGGGHDGRRKHSGGAGFAGHAPPAGQLREQKAGPGAHRRMTMDQTVEKTIDRLSDLLDRANKAAQDLEVKDRLTDAVAALRRTRIPQDEDAG